MFTLLLALGHAAGTPDSPTLDEILQERAALYGGAMGDELRARDALRWRASVAFAESELLRVQRDRKPRAQVEPADAQWSLPGVDVACDGAVGEARRTLVRDRFGGSLYDALQLGQHPACPSVLSAETCDTLSLVLQCAAALVAAPEPAPAPAAPDEVDLALAVPPDEVDALIERDWALDDLPPKHPIARHRQRYRQVAVQLDARLEALLQADAPVRPEAWCQVHADRLQLAMVEPEAFTDVDALVQDRDVLRQSAAILAVARSGCGPQRERVRARSGMDSLDPLWEAAWRPAPTELHVPLGPIWIDGVRIHAPRIYLAGGPHLFQRVSGQGFTTRLIDVPSGQYLALGEEDGEIALRPLQLTD